MSDRFRTPYVSRTPYQRGSLGELIARRGDIEAQGALQSGNAWANAISDVGNIAAGAFQQYGAQKEERAAAQAKALADAPRIALETRSRELDVLSKEKALQEAEREARRSEELSALFSGEKLPTQGQLIKTLGPERGMTLAKGLSALNPDKIAEYKDQSVLLRDALYGVAAVPEAMRPEAYKIARTNLVTRGLIPEDFAPPEYSTETFQQLMNYGKAPEAPKGPETSVVGRSLVDKATGNVIYRDPSEPKQDNEPLVPVIGDDGQPVLMRRSQAEGRKPASNREQGRPVTSGDAGRLAELDNSIDLAGKLLNEMKTGTDAWLGTKVPDWLTQATGLGAESKAQNGMIKLAKQIIGKALEGGVLRKEDESKYSDILAKIEDPPEVANAKMQGLFERVKQKREFELNAREDAGYDVSKFRQRQGGGTQEGPKPPPRTPVPDSGKDPLGIRK